MDWFEKLTGFREANYDETRAKLSVEGSRLRSLVNSNSYEIGQLELVSLRTLRKRAESGPRLAGRLKVRVVRGDVRKLHQAKEYAGALFQVASQFNLLEMTCYNVTPEHGVTRYQCDHTQGPACAIAAGAATIYRNYFAPVGGGHGQTKNRQFWAGRPRERIEQRAGATRSGAMENAERLRLMHTSRPGCHRRPSGQA